MASLESLKHIIALLKKKPYNAHIKHQIEVSFTLAPDVICQRCTYTNGRGDRVQPTWKDPPGGQKYYPSYNMAPSAHCPVIISSRHCNKSEKGSEAAGTEVVENERVIQPMMWGLVPHWHKGSDVSSFGYKMNNARSDGLLSKVSFKRPLETGKRCVVLADGYFEWNTSTGGKKQPYFIYFPTDSKEKIEEVKQEQAEGKRLITMAGLFDVWKSTEGSEPLYSYAIITVDAHPSLSFIHDRMPAILNNDEEIKNWLDEKTSLEQRRCILLHISKAAEIEQQKAEKEVMKLIRPVDSLVCHPVTTSVNDSRYKSSDTVLPIDLQEESKKKTSSAESAFMKGWLKSGTQQKRSSDDQKDDSKKQKL